MGKRKIDLLLVVRGDCNDADFVTQITPITKKELERFLPLIEAIKNFKPYKGLSSVKEHGLPQTEWTHNHNWPRGEFGCREDLGEKTLKELYGEIAERFDEEYVPNGGGSAGYSLHTIVEIFIVKLDEKVFTASDHYKGWAIV